MLDKRAEQIEEDAVGRTDFFGDGRVDQRAEHEWRPLLLFRAAVDARRRGFGLFDAVQVRDAHRVKLHLLELRQDGITEGCRRNTGAVGHDEYGAFNDGAGHKAWCTTLRKRYNPARLPLTPRLGVKRRVCSVYQGAAAWLRGVGSLSKHAFFSFTGDFMSYVVSFEQLRMTDVDSVGGKNASLGEMI